MHRTSNRFKLEVQGLSMPVEFEGEGVTPVEAASQPMIASWAEGRRSVNEVYYAQLSLKG
jgi:hypothetical protein